MTAPARNATQSPAPGTGSAAATEYLAFTLGHAECAVPARKVRSIRCFDDIATVARAPAFICGEARFQGRNIPVVDLATERNACAAPVPGPVVVLILDVAGREMGLVVDRVCDVLALSPAQITPAPRTSGLLCAQYLQGVATAEERTLILVDVDRLIAGGIMDRAAAL